MGDDEEYDVENDQSCLTMGVRRSHLLLTRAQKKANEESDRQMSQTDKDTKKRNNKNKSKTSKAREKKKRKEPQEKGKK